MGLHDKYGTIVKLNPSTVMISDKDWIKEVLAKLDLPKAPLYNALQGKKFYLIRNLQCNNLAFFFFDFVFNRWWQSNVIQYYRQSIPQTTGKTNKENNNIWVGYIWLNYYFLFDFVT